MDNKDRQILTKIYKHITAILSYCEYCTAFEDFKKDNMRVEACVFNLMQIGELAKTSLSDDIKRQIPSIPWKQIYGMRNRIVHGYDGIELKIVWETISNDLPILQKEVKNALSYSED